jgi:hypothetical protein
VRRESHEDSLKGRDDGLLELLVVPGHGGAQVEQYSEIAPREDAGIREALVDVDMRDLHLVNGREGDVRALVMYEPSAGVEGDLQVRVRVEQGRQGPQCTPIHRGSGHPRPRGPPPIHVRYAMPMGQGTTMQIYYLLPLLIIAAFAYSFWARNRAVAQVQSLSPEEAAARFHDFYSGYFDLEGAEQIVGAFSGVEYQGAKSGAEQIAGAALNSASAAVIGVSTYVPQVQIGLTSTGRVLVSREYSEMGERGSFEQILALPPGTRALDGKAARPGEDLGKAPKNALNPGVALEYVELQAPSGETYAAWLSPQGAQIGHDGFRPITAALG